MPLTATGFDDADRLQALVLAAKEKGQRLQIIGQGTKAHLVPAADDDVQLLSVAEHIGIEHYTPAELVVTVRAGTPLADLERALAREHQMLNFEPPKLTGGGTVGGAVAAGLAGPGRPWRGGVRDALLGVEMLNGLGERLRFGGQVMKNVAGYDLSRLQAGACGHFGVLLAVSLRVTPMPVVEKTYRVPIGEDVFAQLREYASSSLPLTALAVAPAESTMVSTEPSHLHLRLAGSAAAVAAAGSAVGGSEITFGAEFWQVQRDQQHLIFRIGQGGSSGGVEDDVLPLYRVSVPAGVGALPELEQQQELIEWGGRLRWIRTNLSAAKVAALVALHGGHSRRYSLIGDANTGSGLDPNAGTTLHEAELLQRLRRAFDPAAIFCPLLTAPNRSVLEQVAQSRKMKQTH